MLVDVDATVIEVFLPNKHGAGIGYTKMRGRNALIVWPPPLALSELMPGTNSNTHKPSMTKKPASRSPKPRLQKSVSPRFPRPREKTASPAV